MNAEWARGWLRGMDPGGKCISSLLCFTSFLSFSVCVSHRTPPPSSPLAAPPLWYGPPICFSLYLSLSPLSLALSLHRLALFLFFHLHLLIFPMLPSDPSSTYVLVCPLLSPIPCFDILYSGLRLKISL